jgi:hypothetical protein
MLITGMNYLIVIYLPPLYSLTVYILPYHRQLSNEQGIGVENLFIWIVSHERNTTVHPMITLEMYNPLNNQVTTGW